VLELVIGRRRRKDETMLQPSKKTGFDAIEIGHFTLL